MKNTEDVIRNTKNKAVRGQAEKQLDALRRALENADGLDVVFQKYITEKSGKYLVFCANKEHMDEMAAHTDEWFGRIDEAPHVYQAYSSEPETSKEFAEFKADESGHLKLLFCIDMLNEGVHVEDISGVILFRPTVSPIIYKQQIGRAMSAGSKINAVILDIVNNIENLYSIGSIEVEMQAAVNYYRNLGEEKKIISEHFHIIDEVRDCKLLFDELNETLSASWDVMYRCARAYYRTHGNLEVPNRYKTPDGYSLGMWLMTQRRVRAGEQTGKLDADRIRRLDEIGMVWENRIDHLWERNFAEAERYYRYHGDLNVNASYVTDTGLRLGRWICNLRQCRRSGIKQGALSAERIERLNAIGMQWNASDFNWEQNYLAAKRYYQAYGDLNVPSSYVSGDGIALGAWLQRLRGVRAGNVPGAMLTGEQIRRLEEIGMRWTGWFEQHWEEGYIEAQRYFNEYGDLDVPVSFRTSSGFCLGKWLERQRTGRDGNILTSLTAERRKKLDSIGMIWERTESWQIRFMLAETYYWEHGDLNIPQNYVVEGIWLGKWLYEQRRKYRKGMLLPKQVRELETIGMDWLTSAERAWEEKFSLAEAYFKQYGNLNIPRTYRT